MKKLLSLFLAFVMALGILPAGAFAAGTAANDPPAGSFELDAAGTTAWNGGDDPLAVYAAETGTAQAATIPAGEPFALLENGNTRLKIGYCEGGWTGDTLESTGWVDKDSILVNLPDLIPSIAYVREDGVEVKPHPWLTGCLVLSGTGDMERLQAYQKGYFYVQDVAARLAVTAAQICPGQRVLDCCAAPGGKSFAAGVDMDNQGKIISCDIHPHKIKLLKAGADRLGMTCMEALLQSASERRDEWVESFDTVLVDAPCSGLGIIRKKPDIRYKDPKPLEGLPQVQKKIVDNCAAYVRPGGVMIYATCTLRTRENEDVVTWFLERHPEFALEPFLLPQFGHQAGMITFWPHMDHTDGFFAARLRKKEV